MNYVVEIKNLKKHFKEVKAVDDISFKVKEGDLFAFLGLNGAGKSTTINIIAGALDKDEGEVLIDGINIDNNHSGISSILGIVFQHSVLDDKLTVLDNLRYRAGLYNVSKLEFNKNLEFLSDKLDFKTILNRPLNKLSGGQKRRVDIARALIHNPKLLILDEPTTGLDPVTRILVWNLLGELRKKQKLTVFLTTHYMEEASEADQVVIIDEGKIVANDNPINLKNKYANDFIKIYKYNKKLLTNLKKQNYEFNIEKDYIEISLKNVAEAKNIIVNNASLINDFEVIKGKMDNVFLNVTGKQLKEF